MDQYLFLCTIGPVQSFIQEARKTRDLFNGSQILSQLIGIGMEVVGKEFIIFPHPDISVSYPNRFIALLPKESDPSATGKVVEKAIRQTFNSMARDAIDFRKIGIAPPGFWLQVEQHLEIFWAALPLKSSSEYCEVYQELEQTLGAIKNVRPFDQYAYQLDPDGTVTLGERGRKCNLDGKNNALFYRSRDKKNPRPLPFMLPSETMAHSGDQMHRGEAISAIGFLKRFYKKQDFPSVADIALKQSVKKLLEASNELECPVKFLKCINTQLLYENYTDSEDRRRKILDELDENKVPVNIEVIKGYQEEVWKKLKSLEKTGPLIRFTPYYAILLFDGDNMGKWLGADPELVQIDSGEELLDFHRQFAKQLAGFAIAATEETQQKFDSRVVYAGGDDFLALVNLNQLFPLLKRLRELFREKVSDSLSSFLQPGKELSFTAGICIAQVKEPLRLVLREAKRMEKAAKKEFKEVGKDAIGITLIKGSGERHEIYWRQLRGEQANVLLFEKILARLQSTDFSDNFILNLDRTFSPLSEKKPTQKAFLNLGKELVMAETMRLVRRSYCGVNDPMKKEKACKDMFEPLKKLFDQFPHWWSNFINTLHLLNFLENELNLIEDGTQNPSA